MNENIIQNTVSLKSSLVLGLVLCPQIWNDGAYRLTQYYKDANDEENRVSQDWTLDGVYNWTEFTDYGTTETRTHNSVNEVTAIDTNNDADFLYDKNGNLTKWTDDPGPSEVAKVYMWDGLNRLTKIKVAGNDEAIFIYDVNNQRVRKEYDSDDDGDIDTDDDIIAYVWANGHVIEEYVNPADAGYSLDRNYVHGNQFVDELVLFEDSSGDYHYYLQDFRYTVYALVDDTGTIEERYRFDPYGKRTVVTNDGSIDEHYGFTGRYHDDSDETDLIYFRNRWMSPEMGRFVNRDPAEYVDGMNLYAGWFVVGMNDPYGLQKKLECYPVDTPLFPGKWHYTGLHYIQKPQGGGVGLKIIQKDSVELRWYRVNELMLHICPPQCCMDILEDRLELYSIIVRTTLMFKGMPEPIGVPSVTSLPAAIVAKISSGISIKNMIAEDKKMIKELKTQGAPSKTDIGKIVGDNPTCTVREDWKEIYESYPEWTKKWYRKYFEF